MAPVTSPRLSEETGRVLGGRYRLVAPVGVGTSSRVFLAVDTQLRRRVAVKLLHEALAEDEGFLKRFRAEARAAGALNHPNIVAVYDWGEDRSDGVVVPYLVTEYLGGGTLRNVLDRGEPLSPSQTLLVGLETARALSHAHLRGLVHRDVKPGNLLFDEEGRLRLADFGLARALAEASWTEPSGAMVGTARYASPEQALGRRLDGRSDVYSLALVLVECVTGQVPFTGDTTASTLALRTQGDLELSASLGGLRSVLERAGRLDPDERPEAAEFEIGLMAAAEELARPEPLPIVPTLGDGEETTELHLAAGLGAVGPTEPVDGAPLRDPEVLPEPPPVVLSDDGSAVLAGDDRPKFADELAGEPGNGNGKSNRNGNAATTAAAAAAVAGAAGASAGVDTTSEHIDLRSGGPSDGPDRSPITVAEEHELLAASRPTSFGRVDPFVPGAGSAPAPAPVGPVTAPGSRAARKADKRAEKFARRSDKLTAKAADAAVGTRRRWPRRLALVLAVLLVLGAGAGWWFFVRVPVHDVPDLVGLDVAAATTEAEQLGFTVDTSTVDRKDGTRPGEVLAQDPGADSSLAEGEQLQLTVSLGATLVPYPEVKGLSQADATASLQAAGLTVGDVTRAFDESVPKDAVIDATPAEGQEPVNDQGQVPKGSVITLSVSDGPAPRVVPEALVGSSVDQARAALAAVQLTADVTEDWSETVAPGFIVSSDTPAGTELPRGDTVRLVMSKGPAPIVVPDVRYVTGSMASQQLEAAGLTVSGIEGPPSGMVLQTDPTPGEQVPRGTAVRIFTKK